MQPWGIQCPEIKINHKEIDTDQLITRETGVQETQVLRINTTMENAGNKMPVEHLYDEEKSVEMKA